MDAGIACATAWGRQPQKRGMNAPEKFTMKKTLTKADIVEAIYEETDKNRVECEKRGGAAPGDHEDRQSRRTGLC